MGDRNIRNLQALRYIHPFWVQEIRAKALGSSGHVYLSLSLEVSFRVRLGSTCTAHSTLFKGLLAFVWWYLVAAVGMLVRRKPDGCSCPRYGRTEDSMHPQQQSFVEIA